MDLGSVTAAVLRPTAPLVLRDERIAISLRLVGSLLDGRARLEEISPDLAREVQAAGADAHVALILPAGPGPARIEIAGRQFVLPNTLRDALLADLKGGTEARSPVNAGTLAATTAPESRSELRLATQALVAASAESVAGGGSVAEHAAAATTLAASGMLRAARNESSRPPEAKDVHFEAPVFDPHDAGSTAAKLAARASAGNETPQSQVAQSLRREVADRVLQGETPALTRTVAGDLAPSQGRGSVQPQAATRDAIAMAGPAWIGQAMRLELAREMQVLPDGAQAAPVGAAAVFVARLQMDLPKLGRIEVRLRLAGASVGATFHSPDSSDSLARLEDALPEFADALSARGLRPVFLQAVAPTEVA